MLEEKREDIEEIYLFKKRRLSREKTKKRGIKNRIFLISLILCVTVLVIVYLFSPISKVYRVSIKGNRYLEDNYYRELSGIDDDSYYLLAFDSNIEDNILKDPLIKSVKVAHLDHKIIEIEVEEVKIIAYIYDDYPYLIDEDGNRILMSEDYYDLISEVPLIEGYSLDEIEEIARGFRNVDDDIIKEISEIHSYPFTYDDKMMEIIMRSGNYVYVSYYGLSLLNNYHSIEASLDLSGGNVCIFLDEITNSGYTSACPYWGETNEEEVIAESE